MISESVIWGGSKVGEYIVQAGRQFRVQIMPGRMIRAWPEPQVHPMPAWAGQWVGGMRRVVVGERWDLVAEVGGTYICVGLGVVTNIEAVELVIDGPVLPGSVPGRYRIFSMTELAVVDIGMSGNCRVGHARQVGVEGWNYVADGKIRAAQDFIFSRGTRGTVLWEDPSEAGERGFVMDVPAHRIEWAALRRGWRRSDM